MEIVEDSQTLIREALEGSSQAFSELVRQHQGNIRLFLARFTHDATLVDDLAQEVFLTAFRNLSKFRNESTISTWLHGIAKNKALHFLRSESRRKAKEKKSFEAALMNWQTKALEPESESDQENFLEWLDECVSNLAPAGKVVVDQYYFQGKSSAEVGEQLNKGSGAIRMMLVRIRRALLKCLTKKKNSPDRLNSV